MARVKSAWARTEARCKRSWGDLSILLVLVASVATSCSPSPPTPTVPTVFDATRWKASAGGTEEDTREAMLTDLTSHVLKAGMTRDELAAILGREGGVSWPTGHGPSYCVRHLENGHYRWLMVSLDDTEKVLDWNVTEF